MRALVVFILLCITVVFDIKAQQRYDNQFVFGFSGSYMPTSGYGANLSLEKYLGRSFSSLKLEGIFMDRNLSTQVQDYQVESSFYGAGFYYGYSLEKYIPSPLYLNLSVGGVGGYEKLSYDDSFIDIQAKDKFVYGLSAAIQFEVIAYKSLSFFIEPKVYYLLNSDLRKMNGSLGAGMKIYL